MPVKLILSNFRVEVFPLEPALNNASSNELLEMCRRLEKKIKRHLDPSEDNLGMTVIRYDNNAVCSYCGSIWTEGVDSVHNGGCCDEDAANMGPE